MNIQHLVRWLQLDRSLSFALLARIWQAVSGPITMALLVSVLDLHQIGVFYGILSVVGIQPLFELGLASVLIGQAGNLVGRQGASANAIPSASGQSLNWLARGGVRWFSTVACLYAIGGLVIGWDVLGKSGISQIDWRQPLILAVLISALSMAILPRVYVLEGAGLRDFVYRMRFWQAVVGSLTMWCALWFGAQLWAIVAVFFVGVTFHASIAFGSRARQLLARPAAMQLSEDNSPRSVASTQGDKERGRQGEGSEDRSPPSLSSTSLQQMSWLAHIGPLQWRVAAISAAHYLASQLLYLYVLNYHRAEQAAPLGMTLQVAVAVQSLALAWAQTKFPLISRAQTDQGREAAGTLWRQTALVSTGLLVLGISGLAIAIIGLAWLGRGWEKAFVSPPLVLVLGVGYVANHWLALQSYYVLSRGAKPLVTVSLIGLLFTAAAVWWGGKEYSVPGVIFGYALAMICVTLPLHTWAYLKFRAQ